MISRRTRHVAGETLLTLAAVAGVVCVLAALAAVLLDVRPLVFRSGSMAPAIPTGALAMAQTTPVDELQVGDVVSVPGSDGVRVTHRIVDVEPARSDGAAQLTLQGDANGEPDSSPYVVTQADRVFWSQAGLGHVVVALGSRPAVFTGGAVVGGVLVWAFRRRRTPPTTTSEDATTGLPTACVIAVATAALVAGTASSQPTLAAFRDDAAASGQFSTTAVAPVSGYYCETTGILLTTATVHWSAPATGPAPTGYRATVTTDADDGAVTWTGTLPADARSFEIPPTLLTLGTYRVTIRSVVSPSWLSPPPNPPYVRVSVLDLLGIGLVSACAS